MIKPSKKINETTNNNENNKKGCLRSISQPCWSHWQCLSLGRGSPIYEWITWLAFLKWSIPTLPRDLLESNNLLTFFVKFFCTWVSYPLSRGQPRLGLRELSREKAIGWSCSARGRSVQWALKEQLVDHVQLEADLNIGVKLDQQLPCKHYHHFLH